MMANFDPVGENMLCPFAELTPDTVNYFRTISKVFKNHVKHSGIMKYIFKDNSAVNVCNVPSGIKL